MADHADVNYTVDGEDGATFTALELQVNALVNAILAATYPSDTELRLACCRSAAVVGLDYIEALAQTANRFECPTNEARWRVAAYLSSQVADLRAAGAEIRSGMLRTGQRANGAGMPLNEDDDEGTSESWDA